MIKIITPKYFIGTFFNKNNKTFEGVTFGTYKVKKAKYTETIMFWSWDDNSMIGTQPSFDWEITTSDQYIQSGVLSSDKYDNYTIEEKYDRIEDLQVEKKYWTEKDRQTLLENLIRTREEIAALTINLTDEQWHFNPDKDSWNIAQVLEHIGYYDRYVYKEAQVAFVQQARPELATTTYKDDYYLKWMAEPKPHFAVSYAIPLGLMKGRDNLEFFIYGRGLLEGLVIRTQRDLRSHFIPRRSDKHGLRSIHGLITVHYGHTDRHIRQIKRIIADKNFPHAN